MKFRSISGGKQVPVLGFGTWRLGGMRHPDASQDKRIITVLQSAIDMGYTHLDTAEMYGGGHTEELVGQAIRDFNRERIQIVTKVWHTNLNYHDVHEAFKGSTKRLGVDYIDFFAIHLPSAHIPMAETFRALNELVDRGLVHYLGVSNFTTEQLKMAQEYAKTPIAISQAPCSLYNRKFLKGGLLAHCQQNNILMAAYSPFERGDLLENPVIGQIARKYKASPAQVALHWISRQPSTMVYLMSLNTDHLKDDMGALDLELSPEDIHLLDELDMPEEKLWPQ